jgi:hypothetical protein
MRGAGGAAMRGAGGAAMRGSSSSRWLNADGAWDAALKKSDD